MSEPLFNIVFFGILQPGKDKDIVMQNMAKLFKTEPAKLKPLFAGGRKVIKSSVDELVAEKYRVTLENIGLVIKIEDAAEQPTKTEVSPATSPASEADTGGASIAAVGADLVEKSVEVVPQKIGDIRDISMAEAGANVIEKPMEVTPQEIDDISDISMAEVGADVIKNPVEVTPHEIGDISDISMAEAGADMIENPKEKEKTPIPDISELSLK